MIKQDLDHSVIISQYWMKDYRSYADPTSQSTQFLLRDVGRLETPSRVYEKPWLQNVMLSL